MTLEQSRATDVSKPCDVVSWRQNWGEGVGHRPRVFACLRALACLLG